MELSDDDLLRYSRHILLPQIDVAGQQKINDAHVVVIGVGGLGSPVSMYLAAAGVGALSLVDDDRVEMSNLQRQIVHTSERLGDAKVDSAATHLAELNPALEIRKLPIRVDETSLLPVIDGADVVVDCSDNFSTREAVNEGTRQARIPLVSGAAIRFEGQISVFRNDIEDAACYHCLYGDGVNEDETCTTNGVFAPLLGVIGSIQAMETLKLICDIGDRLENRMLLFDGLSMAFQEMRFKRDPGCRVCGDS